MSKHQPVKQEPANRFINYMNNTEKTILPSRYQHGDKVKHILIDESKVNESRVIKIHFTEPSVFYDIELKCYWPEGETPKDGFEVSVENFYHTRLYNVPSSFLIPIN